MRSRSGRASRGVQGANVPADTGGANPAPMRRAAPFVLALLAAGCRPVEPPEAPDVVVRRHLDGANPFAHYEEDLVAARFGPVRDPAQRERMLNLMAPNAQHLRGAEVGRATVSGDTARVRVRLVLPRYRALVETAADDSTGRRLGRAAHAEMDRGVKKGPALQASVKHAVDPMDSLFRARADLRVDTTLDVVLVRRPAGWRVVRDYVTG